ncbi:hypothetical protein AVEN_21267-1 [Araneus ventricosus]|uniref:Uncharacterized protein n=1 Tax=Araneus ventricosus TaxID=182803 RepID=A0A4Y2VCC6_ARAVE|nr:hypothetical protein AVEN_21267-1 [Araneus ventricosus]
MSRTTPGLDRPAPKFRTTTIGGHLPTTSDLTCSRSHTRRIFSGIVFRTRNVPAEADLTSMPPRPHSIVACSVEQSDVGAAT